MSSVIQRLCTKGIISPPKFVEDNLLYEVQTGSVAYGMSSGESDTDIVGVVMNPRADFFQNERGYINGFGPPPKSFTTWQSHHNVDSGVEYDITVYGLANWFDLMANSNPNMVELLWIPVHCIRVNTLIAQHVRANRKMFLSKNAKHKFIGYAYAQLKKIDNKDPKGKRAQLVAAHGFDTKFLAHLVRLTLEAEQILQEGDIDLMKNSELLKGIRRGEWTEEQGRAWFSEKEKYLEKLYQESALQHSVDMDAIRNLLVECIEMHYGSVDKVLKIEGKNDKILRQIKDLLDKADL